MIRNITKNDLNSLNLLTSYFNLHINENDLKKTNDYYIGYFKDNKLIGFINYSIYYERAELNYIFVMEQYRNLNIASQMLDYVLNKINMLENITLEVSENNYAAIKLYEKYGFQKCAIREKYYGQENAILMIKKFGDKNE